MTNLMTKAQVAEFLQVTPRTVDTLRKDGLPSLTVGGSIRFDQDEVMAYLRALRADAAAAVDHHTKAALRQAETEALGEAIRSFPDPNRFDCSRDL